MVKLDKPGTHSVPCHELESLYDITWSKVADLEPKLNDLLCQACWTQINCQHQVAEQRMCAARRAKMIWDEDYEPDDSWWGALTEDEWDWLLASTQECAWNKLRQSVLKLVGRYSTHADHPVLGTRQAFNTVCRRLYDAVVGTEGDEEYAADERRAILDYCQSDVDALARRRRRQVDGGKFGSLHVKAGVARAVSFFFSSTLQITTFCK